MLHAKISTDLCSKDDEIDCRLYEHHVSLMSHSTAYVVLQLNRTFIDLFSLQEKGFTPPAPSYFTYFWKPEDRSKYESATLMESRTTIEGGTTGLKTWRASLTLAQYLITHPGILIIVHMYSIGTANLLRPDLVRSKSLLELGSGAGLLGIIAANLQLSELPSCQCIYLTDVNPEVLARCSKNVNLPCSSWPSLFIWASQLNNV